jgi:hypothetical protein
MQQAIAIPDLTAGDGGDAVAGDYDSDEVDGVSGGYGDDGIGVAGAGCAEGFDGLREGELLATEAGDEAAAADFTAGFQTTEDSEEIGPLRDVGLACEEVPEEDSVAIEEHAGGRLVGCVGSAGLLDC